MVKRGTMSIEMKYDQNSPILRISTSGRLDYDEFSFFIETIVNSKDYPANINTIWDLREADFSSVDNNFWENLIKPGFCIKKLREVDKVL